MTTEALCACCRRCGGAPAGGAPINSIGCTGACLHWAFQLMENPPSVEREPRWEDWRVSHEDLVALRIICSKVNAHGCGYLNRNLVDSQTPGIMWASSWIKLVFDQYSDFLRHANADAMDAQCPAKIKTFYDTLSMLHAQCSELPTKVYTMHFQPTEADAWQVRMTTMSGRHVCDVAMPCTGTMNALEHVPQPLYRVAGDGNLYTHQQYTAYYGEEITKQWWSSAAPCYDHRICLVTANSRMTQDALSCT